jgi:hypothetical protein
MSDDPELFGWKEIENLQAIIEQQATEIAVMQTHKEILALAIVEQKAEIERLRTALRQMLIGVNHIATHRADNWPDPGTDHMAALEKIGACKSYDMWCCWNAAMMARGVLPEESPLPQPEAER